MNLNLFYGALEAGRALSTERLRIEAAVRYAIDECAKIADADAQTISACACGPLIARKIRALNLYS